MSESYGGYLNSNDDYQFRSSTCLGARLPEGKYEPLKRTIDLQGTISQILWNLEVTHRFMAGPNALPGTGLFFLSGGRQEALIDLETGFIHVQKAPFSPTVLDSFKFMKSCGNDTLKLFLEVTQDNSPLAQDLVESQPIRRQYAQLLLDVRSSMAGLTPEQREAYAREVQSGAAAASVATAPAVTEISSKRAESSGSTLSINGSNVGTVLHLDYETMTPDVSPAWMHNLAPVWVSNLGSVVGNPVVDRGPVQPIVDKGENLLAKNMKYIGQALPNGLVLTGCLDLTGRPLEHPHPLHVTQQKIFEFLLKNSMGKTVWSAWKPDLADEESPGGVGGVRSEYAIFVDPACNFVGALLGDVSTQEKFSEFHYQKVRLMQIMNSEETLRNFAQSPHLTNEIDIAFVRHYLLVRDIANWNAPNASVTPNASVKPDLKSNINLQSFAMPPGFFKFAEQELYTTSTTGDSEAWNSWLVSLDQENLKQVQAQAPIVANTTTSLLMEGLEMGALSAILDRGVLKVMRKIGREAASTAEQELVKLSLVLLLRTMSDKLVPESKREFVDARLDRLLSGVTTMASYDLTKYFFLEVELLGRLLAKEALDLEDYGEILTERQKEAVRK